MQSLKNAGISDELIFFDNVGSTPGKADQMYAVVSLSFTDTIQDTVFCEGIEDLRGSIQCNIYTPRNEGSVQGEAAALNVIKDWQYINSYKMRKLQQASRIADYQNAVAACTNNPIQRINWDLSNIQDQAFISLCDDSTLPAGVINYDNADVQPRAAIIPAPDITRLVIRQIDGPLSLAPTSRPHHTTVVSATWLASIP